MALVEELELQGKWLFKHRGVLPLLILTLGVLVFVQSELKQDPFFIDKAYYELFCLLVSLFGLFIRIVTVGYIPKRTSGRNKNLIADKLNTSGMYSLVRHPLYVGNFFMWLGPSMLTANFWFICSFCLFYRIYYERIMFAEEQFLRNKFGAYYLDWAKDVPSFIPNFKNYIKPDLPFSWKRILEKEKNGLLALFTIFCFFDILGELVNGRRDFNYILIGAWVLSGLYYLVIKFLEKRTTLLKETGR